MSDFAGLLNTDILLLVFLSVLIRVLIRVNA